MSRAGRPFTGIDRVEYAYLSHLLADGPLWGLVRTHLGFLLLDTAGCATLKSLLDGGVFPAPDLLSRWRRRDRNRAGAEVALRRVAVARCVPAGLQRMLRRLPAGSCYINVGHSLFSPAPLRDLRIAVLVHDTIPLDHPGFTRNGVTERFRRFLECVGQAADLVICNSDQTRCDVARHLPAPPQCVVAHLGVERSDPSSPPAGPWDGSPFFVVLGTVEPRKNHRFLLDLWQKANGPAHLLICGARGWANAEVFARLDRGCARVHELPGLTDGEIAALLRASAGLLFPSLAEGYGLPPMEAAALGVPVLANDLDVLREIMGDIPVYAPVHDGYLWQREIDRMVNDWHTSGSGKASIRSGYCPPDWQAHFKTVLTLI